MRKWINTGSWPWRRNSRTALSGTRTGELSIRSPATYRWPTRVTARLNVLKYPKQVVLTWNPLEKAFFPKNSIFGSRTQLGRIIDCLFYILTTYRQKNKWTDWLIDWVSDKRINGLIDWLIDCLFKRTGQPIPQWMNVIIVGLDSVSRFNMMRTMNRSRHFLFDTLHAVEFINYDKVSSCNFFFFFFFTFASSVFIHPNLTVHYFSWLLMVVVCDVCMRNVGFAV